MLVKYHKQAASTVTKGRTWWRTDDSNWWSVYEEAKRVGRDRAAVKASIRTGRPTHVPSQAFFCMGGPLDGTWAAKTEIMTATGYGRKLISAQCDDRTGCYVHRQRVESKVRPPVVRKVNRQMAAATKRRYSPGQNIAYRPASLFASMPRVAHG